MYPDVHPGSLRKTVLMMGLLLKDSMEDKREPSDCNAFPVTWWGEVVLHVGIYIGRDEEWVFGFLCQNFPQDIYFLAVFASNNVGAFCFLFVSWDA